MYFGLHRSMQDVDDRATLRDDRLLNLFFPFLCSLRKELNALRLNDALSSGNVSGKNRFLTQEVKRSAFARPSPLCVCETSLLPAKFADSQRGGMCFACRSEAIARRDGPQEERGRACDVRTPWQAAKKPP